ncbi:hypothetical protein [Metapseudomonas resinovorans]|uniref:hypothetical protein n=1 Tax=Metapseudomonas resinovorans TaxID=53412 RepID=UPI00049202B5|nr:hypothetical protein [Pseudomonas resinovorans]
MGAFAVLLLILASSGWAWLVWLRASLFFIGWLVFAVAWLGGVLIWLGSRIRSFLVVVVLLLFGVGGFVVGGVLSSAVQGGRSGLRWVGWLSSAFGGLLSVVRLMPLVLCLLASLGCGLCFGVFVRGFGV